MKVDIFKRVALFSLISIVLFASVGVSFAQMTPPEMLSNGRIDKQKGIGVTQNLGAQVPGDATFTNSSGQVVQLSQYFGKSPILLNLMYYHCKSTCTLETDNLLQSLNQMKVQGSNQDLVGKDVQAITLSINPQEGPTDSAQERQLVLSELTYPTAQKGWHFLTGDINNIQKVVTAVGFHYTLDQQNDLINHPAVLVLLTPTGLVSRYFFGATYPPAILHSSLAVAHANHIGHHVQEFLLGCFCLDPVTGKYSANILQLLRVLGGFTLLVVGGSFVVLSRRKSKFEKLADHAHEESINQ